MKSGTLLLALLGGILSFGQTGPPSGYSVVVAAPPLPLGPGQFGDCVDMVLANGDPALTYLFYNPTGTGDLSSSAIYFVRWDRAQAGWTTPVRIAIVGDNAAAGAGVASSMAYDPTSATLAVEYLVGHGRMDFASSQDGGQTWKTQILAADSEDDLSAPALAIGGGKVYAAFLRNGEGIRFLSGTLGARAGSWASQVVPGAPGAPRSPISLNTDKSGNPGLAFWMYSDTGNSVLGFWRPGYPRPIRVGDTDNIRNDFVSVSLAYFGSNPRIAVFADLDPAGFRSPTYATQSNDGGLTWSPFIYITADTGQVQGGHVSLAIDSRGQAAVTFERLRGDDRRMCEDPILARSVDFLNWTTCAATGPDSPKVEAHDARVVFDLDNRIYIAFQNTKAGDLPAGVILWHEPVPVTRPEIAAGGVVNAASVGTPIAPGSLSTIFGTNFLDGSAVSASSTPLPRELGEVTVSIAGTPAPLLYVAPSQINFQVPYETPLGTVDVLVTSNGVSSNVGRVDVAPMAPGIFTYGANFAAAQNEDYSITGPSAPATAGGYVMIYATGCGTTDNPVPTGTVAPDSPLSRVSQPVRVTIGNRNAPVSFAGLAPGFVGLTQLNVQVPNLPPGSYPVQITFANAVSNQPNISVE